MWYFSDYLSLNLLSLNLAEISYAFSESIKEIAHQLQRPTELTASYLKFLVFYLSSSSSSSATGARSPANRNSHGLLVLNFSVIQVIITMVVDNNWSNFNIFITISNTQLTHRCSGCEWTTLISPTLEGGWSEKFMEILFLQ